MSQLVTYRYAIEVLGIDHATLVARCDVFPVHIPNGAPMRVYAVPDEWMVKGKEEGA